MARFLMIVLAFPVLIWFSMAAPVPKHLMPEEPDYFPTKVGAKWVWQCGEEERSELVTEVEVQRDGTKIVTVGYVNPRDEVIQLMALAVSKKGLFQLSQGGHTFETSYCLLKFPVCDGEQWVNTKPSFWDRTCTVHKPEWVVVPAGRFWATRVDSDEFRVPGKLERVTVWYAPGVGPVKRITSSQITVLKSITLE